MASPGGGGGQQQDNSLGPLWIMVGLCVGLALIWFLFHTYIMMAFIHLKLFEISLFSIFTNKLDNAAAFLRVLQPDDVTWRQAYAIASQVGSYIAIPSAVILLVIAYVVFKGNSAKDFRNVYDMHKLADSGKELWPQIKPAFGLNLSQQDLDKGPWAMSVTPMAFAKRKKLIIEEEAPLVEGELRRGKKIVARLDRGKANALFLLQLGDVWSGHQKLPAHLTAVFAILMARANHDIKASDQLLTQISNSFDNKKNTANFAGAKELCEKYINSKVVQRAISLHAYEFTLLATLLELARCDGVFATADFLWLKPIDRRCWYLLNTIGRRTPFPEAAGIYSHWVAEKELGRKAILPMVEAATDGLEIALSEIIYHPEEKD